MIVRCLLGLVLFANVIVLLDNRKNNRIITCLSVLFIILLMGGCTNSNDYPNYEYAYKHYEASKFEPLYAAFQRLIAKTGAPF